VFMNEYEIERARRLYVSHPILGPATETLSNLVAAVNVNSDGWPYWRSPARAAAKLMAIIVRDGTARYLFDEKRADVTAEEYAVALRPIRAFRTRSKLRFTITEQSCPLIDLVSSLPDRAIAVEVTGVRRQIVGSSGGENEAEIAARRRDERLAQVADSSASPPAPIARRSASRRAP
jgi:hypothetical protein